MKRILFLVLTSLLIIFAANLWAAETNAPLPLYVVLNNEPPSVILVDAEKLKPTATITLEEHPVSATWSSDHKFVYVLCAKSNLGIFQAQGSVAVIDVAKQAVLKTIKIGWNPDRRPIASADQRYLGYHCKGRKGSKKDAEENAALWLLDTTTNELVKTYSSDRYLSLIGDLTMLRGYAAASDDFSRFFLFSQLDVPSNKPALATLSLFSREQSAPLAVLNFKYSIAQTAFSADQKWLYVLESGHHSKKAEDERPGKVFVIDMATGKIAKEHPVGSHPQWLVPDAKNDAVLIPSSTEPDNKGVLYQLKSTELSTTEVRLKGLMSVRELDGLDGKLLVGETELAQLNSDSTTSAAITINKSQKGDNAGPYLEGYPGEMVYFPSARRLVAALVDSYGERTGNVGVIDMESKKVLARISTGHFGSMFLKQMALAAGSGMVQGYNAAYGTHLYAPTGATVSRPQNNMLLWPDPVGKLAYAFNQSTGELHAIQLSDGTVSKVLKFPKESTLKLSGDGQYLIGGSGTLSILDLKTGNMRELQVPGGKMRAMAFDVSRNRALVFSRKSMMVVDYANAQHLASIDQLDLELFAGSPLVE